MKTLELIKVLNELTLEEATALYWVCQGLAVSEIIKETLTSESTHHGHMQKVYIKLKMKEGIRTERKRGKAEILNRTVGSYVRKLVKKTDLKKGSWSPTIPDLISRLSEEELNFEIKTEWREETEPTGEETVPIPDSVIQELLEGVRDIREQKEKELQDTQKNELIKQQQKEIARSKETESKITLLLEKMSRIIEEKELQDTQKNELIKQQQKEIARSKEIESNFKTLLLEMSSLKEELEELKGHQEPEPPLEMPSSNPQGQIPPEPGLPEDLNLPFDRGGQNPIPPPEPHQEEPRPPFPRPRSGLRRRQLNQTQVLVLLVAATAVLMFFFLSIGYNMGWLGETGQLSNRSTTEAPSRILTNTPQYTWPTLTPVEVKEQSPPPGTILPIGRGYTKLGIVVTTKDFAVWDYQIEVAILVKNSRNSEFIFQYRYGDIHLFDNFGNETPLYDCCSMVPDEYHTQTLRPNDDVYISYTHRSQIDFDNDFEGPVEKYILRIDNLAGMTDMIWEYVLE